MIIVEGVDNSGKTTLVKDLINDLSLEPSPFKFDMSNKYISSTEELKMHIARYYNIISDYLINTSSFSLRKIIWDRLYFSEFVYGPVVRDGISIEPINLIDLPILIKNTRPFIICCNPSLDVIKYGYDKRGQYISEDLLETIINRYKYIFSNVDLYTDYFMEYDYTVPGVYDELVERIQEYLYSFAR